MTDNITVDGVTVKTKDTTGLGVHAPFQVIADGSGNAWSGANPLPVSGPVTDAQLRSTPVPVSASALPLPSGAASETTLAGVTARLGEVQATPTANTLLDRVKALLTGIVLAAGSNLIGRVTPEMSSGGNLSVQTAATGANWTVIGAQACKQLTLVNNTGTKIEFRQGGAGVGVVVFDQSGFTIYGITNANQIEIRRVDQANTQVTVQGRWES